MATYTDTLSSKDDLDRPSEYPQKGDLRNLMSQYPLPIIAPTLMSSEESTSQALAVLRTFNSALAANDAKALESCFFARQAFWKDQLALTYHFRTFTTPAVITASLLETKRLRGLNSALEIEGKAIFVPASPTLQFIISDFVFKTCSPAARCNGRLLLLPVKSDVESDPPDWKIWILSTKLEDLDLQPEDEALLRSPKRQLDGLATFETEVLIVGGGNSAVALSARLKAVGVDNIMIERNARVGDNWALRYDCMKFHLPTSFCELPYMTYDKELQYPHLLTKDELAEQVRRFATEFKLNIINSAEVIQTTKIPDGRWRVEFQTPAGTFTAIAKQLVQATGIGSQKPNLPPMSDEQLYKGINLHSARFKSGEELARQGASTVVIIGSGNTAFDVLEDCHAAGIKATMIVRSPTYIVPLDYICHPQSLGLYDFGVDAADRLVLMLPAVVDAQIARNLLRHLASQEPDRYSALAKTGFPVFDSSDPDAALMHNLLERGGGHYVDTGATTLLAEGKAKFKAGVEPVAYTNTGLLLSDGSTIDSDAIIWCTGFADKNARDTVSEILKTPLHVDSTWNIDQEGEIRGMWKRHSRVENFWIMGGYTQQHRWHSRLLAQQIKAALEGILPPAYLETPRV